MDFHLEGFEGESLSVYRKTALRRERLDTIRFRLEVVVLDTRMSSQIGSCVKKKREAYMCFPEIRSNDRVIHLREHLAARDLPEIQLSMSPNLPKQP